MAVFRNQHLIFVFISMILIENPAIIDGLNPNQLSKPKKTSHTDDNLDKLPLQKLNLNNIAAKVKHKRTDLEKNVADQTVLNQLKSDKTNLSQKPNAVNGKKDLKDDAIPNKKISDNTLDNSDKLPLQKLNLNKISAKLKHENTDLEKNVADQTVLNQLKSDKTKLSQKPNAVNGKEDKKDDAIPNKKKISDSTLDSSDKIPLQKLNLNKVAAKLKHKHTDLEKNVADQTVLNQLKSDKTKLSQKPNAVNGKEDIKDDAIPKKKISDNTLDNSDKFPLQKLNLNKIAAKLKHKHTDIEKNVADQTVLNQLKSDKTKLSQKPNAVNGKEDIKDDAIPNANLDKLQLQKLNLNKIAAKLKHKNTDLEKNVADQTVLNQLKSDQTKLSQKPNEVNGREDRENDAIPNKLQTKSLDSLNAKSAELQDPLIKEFLQQVKKILNALDRLTIKYKTEMSKYRQEYNTLTPAQIKEHEQYINNIVKDKEIYGNMLKENAAQISESLSKNRKTDKSSLVRKTPDDPKSTNQNLPKPTEFMPVKSSSGAASDRNGTNKGSSGVSNTGVVGVSSTNGTVSNKGSSGVSNTNGTVSNKGVGGVSFTNGTVSNKGTSGLSDRNGTVSNKGSIVVSDRNATVTDSNVVSERKADSDPSGGLSTGVSKDVVSSEGTLPTTGHDSGFNQDNKSKIKSTDLFGIYHNLLDDLKKVITSRNQAENLEKVVGRKNRKIVMVKFPVESKPDNDQSMNLGLPQKNKEQDILLTKNEDINYVGNNANNKDALT